MSSSHPPATLSALPRLLRRAAPPCLAGLLFLAGTGTVLAVDLTVPVPVSTPVALPSSGVSIPAPAGSGGGSAANPVSSPAPAQGGAVQAAPAAAPAAAPPPAAAAPAGPGNPAPNPAPAPAIQAVAASPNASSGTRSAASGPTVAIPYTRIVVRAPPLSIGLISAIAALPLLVVLWLYLAGRTWSETLARRAAGLRQAMAGELGVPSEELRSLQAPALMKLREQVTFDELTGTLRRAAGIVAVDREIARANRLKEKLSVAFLDVDGLKRINDTKGHQSGDALLKGVASLLQERLRGQDLVFRFGGDEFVCVLPETNLELAEETLREFQSEARAKHLPFSFGVADLQPGDDTVSLLGRADQRLYAAKHKQPASAVVPLRRRRPTVVS